MPREATAGWIGFNSPASLIAPVFYGGVHDALYNRLPDHLPITTRTKACKCCTHRYYNLCLCWYMLKLLLC